MLDWLIIGGGIHGTHLAIVLAARGLAGRDTERVAVVDPHGALLETWRRCTGRVAMPFLRSPAVHNIGPAPGDLLSFAKSPAVRADARFTHPYGRPASSLFAAHCRELVRSLGVDRRHVPTRARRLERLPRGFRVATDDGDLDARRVVLALGASSEPAWPEWARGPRALGAPIHHVFAEDLDETLFERAEDIVVVGGGLSAAQLTLRLAERERGRVLLLSRAPLRVHQFDSDPGWLGPRFLAAYHRTSSLEERRRLIREARHVGSVTPDARFDLLRSARKATHTHVVDEVREATACAEGRVRLRTASRDIASDLVLLATGFDRARPGGPLVDDIVSGWGLPLAPCGYPAVGPRLEWAPGLFVMGPLAELEVGPVARNIAGARKAAERILLAA